MFFAPYIYLVEAKKTVDGVHHGHNVIRDELPDALMVKQWAQDEGYEAKIRKIPVFWRDPFDYTLPAKGPEPK